MAIRKRVTEPLSTKRSAEPTTVVEFFGWRIGPHPHSFDILRGVDGAFTFKCKCGWKVNDRVADGEHRHVAYGRVAKEHHDHINEYLKQHGSG